MYYIPHEYLLGHFYEFPIIHVHTKNRNCYVISCGVLPGRNIPTTLYIDVKKLCYSMVSEYVNHLPEIVESE